jgi:hypothetical protein
MLYFLFEKEKADIAKPQATVYENDTIHLEV